MDKNIGMYMTKGGDTEEYFNDEATEVIEKGVNVLFNILKTTLGPHGALKILKGRDNIVTNDGATILQNLLIDSPSAKMIIDSSKSQDFEEGDGTTSIAVLALLILRHAFKSKVHVLSIIRGISLGVKTVENVLNIIKFEAKNNDVKNLVKTTLNSKVLNSYLDQFVDICMNAVNNLDKSCDLSLINIVKIDGELHESSWVEGLVIDKELNSNEIGKVLKEPKILLVNTHLDYDKIKITSSKIQVNSISELEDIENAEKKRMAEKIDLITQHDFDLIINRQLIYDFPMQLLVEKGKTVIENVGFENIERLEKISGGVLLSHFNKIEGNEEVNSVLGKCGKVETIQLKNKYFTKFTGVKNGASTIILAGSSPVMLDEAERSIHDALCVLKKIKKNPFCLYGGGNVESILSSELNKQANLNKTIKAEGLRILSNAFREFTEVLTENSGYEGSKFSTVMRANYETVKEHYKSSFTKGLNIENGQPGCMKDLGVIEGFDMKMRVLKAACETAQSILKCDGVIKHQPRKRDRC
ncbi:TCPB [Hepatospora eriocheir]|uniref:TCPB n=1 Tax=Hepatospora eriocheir TaxID=1081669 RepID=A0A1X0QEC9_9MICR|nr:TCPB [Hepatospora eriocheir]